MSSHCGKSVRSLAAAALFLCPALQAAPEPLLRHTPLSPALRREQFDLQTETGWLRLADAAVRAQREARRDLEAEAERRRRLVRASSRSMLPIDALHDYHVPGEQGLLRKDERAFQALERIAASAIESGRSGAWDALAQTAREVLDAVRNNHRLPTPRSIPDVAIPLVTLDHAISPVGIGRRVAGNLARAELYTSGRVDPVTTTYWRRPEAIADLDLYHGFGRREFPRIEDIIWRYDQPKSGYGLNRGFDVRGHGLEAGVKFAETRSEPFATRIFWALGYHVDCADQVPGLKVRYDRRLLREFNVRPDHSITINLLGVIPTYTRDLQKHRDPFDFILAAVLKDGTRLDAAAARSRLYCDATRDRPEDDPANFIEEFESRIDHFITVAANVQIKNPDEESLGPWDYAALDHEDLRELRGVGLLAAWIGWYDIRWENTRLRWLPKSQGVELRHVFSDLGGCLGRAHGFFTGLEDHPDEFEWTCTDPSIRIGSPASTRLRIRNFKPVMDVPPMRAMTPGDARWMARLIGQLGEDQIRQALIAAGFDSAAGRLLLEKLVHRRDRMVQDLGLADEFPLLHPEDVDPTFDYDPRVDGPLRARLPDGTFREAPITEQVVQAGRLSLATEKRPRE